MQYSENDLLKRSTAEEICQKIINIKNNFWFNV